MILVYTDHSGTHNYEHQDIYCDWIQPLREHGFTGSDEELIAMWLRFSEIQAGVFLAIEGQSVERLRRWLATGDDDEAWS